MLTSSREFDLGASWLNLGLLAALTVVASGDKGASAVPMVVKLRSAEAGWDGDGDGEAMVVWLPLERLDRVKKESLSNTGESG